jgi:fatty-acyl-CoA synthase
VTESMRTVVQALEDAAESTRTGYRFIEESSSAEPFFTFNGIERATARFAGNLQALGLQKGDRLALILPDNQDFIFAFLGALRAGIIPVPIYPPAGLRKLGGYLDNTLHIVAKSAAKVLLTNALIKGLLGTIQAQAPALREVVAVESLRRARETLKPEKVTLDDTCFLQFTSGSTSKPKGVVVTHGNIAANVHAIMEQGLKVEPGVDSGVSWLPLYHDMGLIGFVLAPLFHRSTISFLPPLLYLKRPVRWLETICRHRANISFGPNFAYALCVKRVKDKQIEGLDLSTWRAAGCGAEPIRADNLRAFADRFASIGFNPKAFMPCYGMAESTLAISFGSLAGGVSVDRVDAAELAAEGKAKPARGEGTLALVNLGKAFPDHDIAVFGPDDRQSKSPLPDREVGEVRLRGPSVAQGYFDDPELTRQALAGGWLCTGDLGYLVDGDVFICGRSKELIIINGRNFYPQDLEWEASKVQGVRKGNVIAFGTRKPLNDRERVVIAYETSIGDPQARDALNVEVRKLVRQATGLAVDDVVPLDAGVLPKTSSGKLKRGVARQLYETGKLFNQTSMRDADPLGAAKEIARSQLGYVKHALFGDKKS